MKPHETSSDPATDRERPDGAPAASGGAAPAGDGGAPAGGEVAELRAKVASLEDRLRRQQADFLNDVRRLQRAADERVKYAVQPVVEGLLGVADALHGAIDGLSDSEHEKRVAEGLRLVEKELLEVLGRHGVARIDAMNKPFDPAVHEAVMEMESPAAERTVLQVTRPGFTLHGRVVRPAHVVVAKPKARGEAPPAAAPATPDDGD
jgi:molecular chaperone GrpE